jgi:hypothetical protein
VSSVDALSLMNTSYEYGKSASSVHSEASSEASSDASSDAR